MKHTKHIGFGESVNIVHPHGTRTVHSIVELYNLFLSKEYNANHKRPYGYRSILTFPQYINRTIHGPGERKKIFDITQNTSEACIVYIQPSLQANFRLYSIICGLDQELFTNSGFSTPREMMAISMEHGGYLSLIAFNSYIATRYSQDAYAAIDSIVYIGQRTLYSIVMDTCEPIHIDCVVTLPQIKPPKKTQEIY